MHPDIRLDISVAALCSRHQFTRSPAAAIQELQELANAPAVSAAVGRWIGFYDSPDRALLVAALREAFAPDDVSVADGSSHRGRAGRGTTGFLNPHLTRSREDSR